MIGIFTAPVCCSMNYQRGTGDKPAIICLAAPTASQQMAHSGRYPVFCFGPSRQTRESKYVESNASLMPVIEFHGLPQARSACRQLRPGMRQHRHNSVHHHLHHERMITICSLPQPDPHVFYEIENRRGSFLIMLLKLHVTADRPYGGHHVEPLSSKPPNHTGDTVFLHRV